MKVIATQKGYYGGRIREVGDVFEFEGEKLGKWMVPAGGAEPQKPEPEPVKAPRKASASAAPAAAEKAESKESDENLM